MDIKALQWELAAFVVDRGLDPLHTPKNLAMALAAESGALLGLFKWANDDDAQGVNRPEQREAAADAIADAVLHAVHLADRLGIDLDEAIRRKLAKNAEKYPIAGEGTAACTGGGAAHRAREEVVAAARESSSLTPAARLDTPACRAAPQRAREVPRAATPTQPAAGRGAGSAAGRGAGSAAGRGAGSAAGRGATRSRRAHSAPAATVHRRIPRRPRRKRPIPMRVSTPTRRGGSSKRSPSSSTARAATTRSRASCTTS